MIASSSGAASPSSVSFTESRYESVATITSLPASKRTRMPVSTGRDSSREADRATRSTVSSSASRSIECSCASTAGSRGKSSALKTFRRELYGPETICTVPSSGRYSIVTSLSGSSRASSTSGLPGMTTAPSPSTCASSVVRSESSMSVAASVIVPPSAREQDPGEHLDGAAGRDGARDEAELRDELVACDAELHPGTGIHVGHRRHSLPLGSHCF